MKKYKLGKRAEEVHRLNMIEGVHPETHKLGEPSAEFIKKRLDDLKKFQ